MPFWFIIAIFSPALLLFFFVGIQSGAKAPVKAKAPTGQMHMSALPVADGPGSEAKQPV